MIAVDVETTGTNPEMHSVLSIGAVEMRNPTNQFYGECRAWEGAHIEDEALTVNGTSLDKVHDPSLQTEAELVATFIAWAREVRGWDFVGQNPSFDVKFVEAACRRAHVEFPFPHRSLDTHTMAFMHLTNRGKEPPFNVTHNRTDMNLDFVLKYVGVPAEPKPHNALTGALCHAEAASRLLYTKKLLPNFDLYPIPFSA